MITFDQSDISAQVLRRVQAVEQAREAVEPVIGKTAAMALDSAAALYCAGLRHLGVNITELRGHDVAAKAAFEAMSAPVVRPSSRLATPKQRAERDQRFPNANRLQQRA